MDLADWSEKILNSNIKILVSFINLAGSSVKHDYCAKESKIEFISDQF